MHDLEGRLEAAAGAWAGALATRAEITTLRTNYEAALENRRAATQKASNARATRDAAKEDFLDVYAQITARVKAEFPRDRPMQDLFFDAVSEDGAPPRTRATTTTTPRRRRRTSRRGAPTLLSLAPSAADARPLREIKPGAPPAPAPPARPVTAPSPATMLGSFPERGGL
jgi:hypothetical protein